MSTLMSDGVTINDALASVPSGFRKKLLQYYGELKKAYARGDFDACGARAGKFSETLIRYLQETLEGAHTPFGTQINLYSESKRLEQLDRDKGPEPFRVYIPRALCFLYTLRNKRGFAHVGGDIDSDPIDAATCVRVADWCLCELIRVIHSLSLEEAQTLTNTIASREIPEVWDVAGKKRVLRTDLDYKDQTLLIAYSNPDEALLVEDLFEWVEYSRIDNYKSRVLSPLHKERLIDWDKSTDTVHISPTGIRRVEEDVLRDTKGV